jgi:membrane-associated phospholipid phosphatase
MGAILVASLLEPVLKEVVARPRPESPAFGFPSGHATAAAAYFGALVYAAGTSVPSPGGCSAARPRR